MIIAKIAFRNIFRHKRRSALTGMMMAGGCGLFALFFGMIDGTYGNLIDMFTRDHTGHIQVHKEGYLEKPSIYKTLSSPDLIGEKIEPVEYVHSWAPRVYTPALAFAGQKTTGARVMGIDPKKEARTTRLKNKVSMGNFLSSSPRNEVVLSSGLARVLNVSLGGEIALIAQGIDGSVANGLYTVVGITGGEGKSYGESKCYMHINDLREFLSMDRSVHEIAVVLTDHSKTEEVTGLIDKELVFPHIDVDPWQVVEAQFYRAMQADLKGNRYSIMVFTIIIAVGVLNTILMVVLERTREFGVLKAIGTRPFQIFQLIIIETFFLSLISIIAGTIIGVLANWWFQVYGVTYPTPIEYGGYIFERLTSKLTLRSILVPPLIIMGTALFVSIWPAVRAARIIPFKAMRSN
jgi:ABC-type lipoprotein release transport system permease subunit